MQRDDDGIGRQQAIVDRLRPDLRACALKARRAGEKAQAQRGQKYEAGRDGEGGQAEVGDERANEAGRRDDGGGADALRRARADFADNADRARRARGSPRGRSLGPVASRTRRDKWAGVAMARPSSCMLSPPCLARSRLASISPRGATSQRGPSPASGATPA